MHNRLLPVVFALLVVLIGRGASAAEEWTKLFNGKDLSGWETYVSKPVGRSEPVGVNKDPSKIYSVTEAGELRISGETFGVISTTKDYENYHLRLEFKWGEKRWPPRHDKKRDSGILYHAFGEYGAHGNHWTRSHELQIQEGDCGDYWSLQAMGTFVLTSDFTTFDPKGILGEPGGTRVIRSADHEKPHGQWNTIELICAGDTATHIVNGQIVNQLINSRKREGDGCAPLTKGRIQLQSEGAEVFYRNIEIRPLALGKASSSQQAAIEPGPPLMNTPPELSGMKKLIGKDLSDWDGDTRLWRLEDGVIVGQTTKDITSKTNTFLIYKGGELKDFELRFSYRIAGGNSGVQYRSAMMDNPTDPANKWRVSGYQAEIADLAGKDGFLYHEQGAKTRGYPEKSRYLCYVGDKVTIDEAGKSTSVGKLADNAALAATYRKGDWNDYVIIARGNVIKHFLNGHQTVEATDNDPSAPKAGLLALQLHQGPPMKIEFRDIRLKTFDQAR